MGMITRGAKNAFRNTIRTLSVTLILALSIGLALIMLISYQTVQAKIESVKSSIGNTITVTPAGARGFEGGGEPLTGTQLAAVSALPHVTSVNETLSDRLTSGTDTSLTSAIDPGTLGARINRFNRGGETGGAIGNGGGQRTFTLPIQVTGISSNSAIDGGAPKLTAGAIFDPASDSNTAIVGTNLAAKNNLSVGSTFTAYGTAISVAGIFDAGNTFANSGIFYVPLKTEQRLSQQTDQVGTATVQVDSITNVDAVTTAIKDKLGTDKADVTSNQDQAQQALTPLENIKTISLYSLIGALVAGAVITLLTMIMIVRERRREIGVLKAIGASNLGVMGQFIIESLVLTGLGSVVGIVVGVLFSNPVLNALVTNSTATAQNPARGFTTGAGGGPQFARIAQFGARFGGGVQNGIRNLHASVGLDILLYGLLAALVIAVLGSALPAWLIAKVKPAEVMRGE